LNFWIELLMPDINILLLTCPRINNVHKSKYVTVKCSLCVQSCVGVIGRHHCVVCSVLMRWWRGNVVLLTSRLRYRCGWSPYEGFVIDAEKYKRIIYQIMP